MGEKILLSSDDFFENSNIPITEFLKRVGNYIKRNFKNETGITVIAKNPDRQEQTGYKYVCICDSYVNIGKNIVPSCDCTFILCRNSNKELIARVYSCNTPTSSVWEFKPGYVEEKDIAK